MPLGKPTCLRRTHVRCSQVGLCRGRRPGQVEVLRSVDVDCETLTLQSQHLSPYCAVTATATDSEGQASPPVLASCHQRLGNRLLSVPLDRRSFKASKVVTLSSEQTGTPVSSTYWRCCLQLVGRATDIAKHA